MAGGCPGCGAPANLSHFVYLRAVPRSLSLFVFPTVDLVQERLRLVARVGLRREDTLTVARGEFTEDIEATAEVRKHFRSIAMRTTELHANPIAQVGDHTTTENKNKLCFFIQCQTGNGVIPSTFRDRIFSVAAARCVASRAAATARDRRGRHGVP